MNRRNFIALPLGFVGLGNKKEEPDLRVDFWVKGEHYAMGMTHYADIGEKEKRKWVERMFNSGKQTALGVMVKQGTLKRELTDIVV